MLCITVNWLNEDDSQYELTSRRIARSIFVTIYFENVKRVRYII